MSKNVSPGKTVAKYVAPFVLGGIISARMY